MEKWNYGGIKANKGDPQAPHHPLGQGHSEGQRAELGISPTFSSYSRAGCSVLMEFDQNASKKAGKCYTGAAEPRHLVG